MIHIHSIRITDGNKCYRPKICKNAFVKSLSQVCEFEQMKLEEFKAAKYPNGIPKDRDMKERPIIVNATYVAIPDREFLHYLVAKLHYKKIPQEILKMFRTK